MFKIVREIFAFVVGLLILIIPIACGFFGGMFREIITTGGNWYEIQDLIAGGYFGLYVKCVIGLFIAILVIRLLLSFLIGARSSDIKDYFYNNISSEWNYPAWVLSVIIGSVIGFAIFGFKILISIIIGFIAGMIVDGIIFGMIVTILNIDENLDTLKNTSSLYNASIINIDKNMGILKDTFLNLKNVNSDDTKKCPFCAEQIKREANICRFCNREVRTEL